MSISARTRFGNAEQRHRVLERRAARSRQHLELLRASVQLCRAHRRRVRSRKLLEMQRVQRQRRRVRAASTGVVDPARAATRAAIDGKCTARSAQRPNNRALRACGNLRKFARVERDVRARQCAGSANRAETPASIDCARTSGGSSRFAIPRCVATMRSACAGPIQRVALVIPSVGAERRSRGTTMLLRFQSSASDQVRDR